MSKKLSGRLAITVLPWMLGLAGCRSAYNYFEKGNTAFAQGKFAESTLDYHAAIQKDPSFGDAYYRAGLSELKQNKAPEALEDLQAAVRLMPVSDAAKTDLTNLMLGAYVGDPKRPKFLYDLLVKYSGDWLKRDPNSMQGLRIKGYLAMLEQRPDDAAELLRRAHQSHPHDEKIVDGLMDALFRANQKDEAEKVGLEFIRTDPGASDIYDALFRLYMLAKRTEDAENILKRKAQANPQERGYLLELASFYAGQHRTQDIDQTMQTYLSGHQGDAATRIQAGDFYLATGALDQAVQQYHAGAELGKQDKLVCNNRIARVLLLQNKHQEGLDFLNKTIAEFPDDQEARALRAALLLQTPGPGKPGQGVDELRALLEKKPNDVFLKFLLARALAEKQDFGEARTRLEEVVKLQPDFLDAHLLLGDVAYKQHDTVETLKQAEAALDIDPQNLRARMLRGSALLVQNDLEQAGAVFGSLAQEVPQSVDIKLKLAEVSLRRRDYAEAEAALNKILQEHPNEARAVEGLVDVDLAQNRPEKALDRLDAELTRSKGSPAIRQLTAVTALRVGKYNLAIENLRELVNQSNSIAPLIEMARVFQLKGDVHSAILTLQKAASLHPQDPRPGNMLPALLEAEDRAQEAKQVARHALTEHPKDPLAMNNLAYLMADTGDNLDEAVKLAKTAVSKQPNNPVFLDTLGFVYLKRDQNDDALDIFQRLIRRYPDDPSCVYHTAMAWYQKGDRQHARTMLSHALELRPPKEIEAGVNDLLSRVN